MRRTFEIDITDKVNAYTDRVMADLGLDESMRDKVEGYVYDDITDRMYYALDEVPVKADYPYLLDFVKEFLFKTY